MATGEAPRARVSWTVAAAVGAPIRVELDIFAAHAVSLASPTHPRRDYFAEGTLDRHEIAATTGSRARNRRGPRLPPI
ncbi:MAG TPA: hypothetical protein VMW65_16310 [Chloroflexota bacterium]|nr:hypothetical protein [Chloroflexota bacterium]